jgi:hypothetical protein
MPAKDVINTVLERATGYRLTRETEAQRAEALRAAEKAGARRQRERTTKGLDPEMRTIIAKVQPRTMTGVPKLQPLVQAVRYLHRHQVPGEVVECGVWRGGSMQAIAYTLLALGDTSRHLHLFDTFEGMPPPTEEDTRVRPDGRRVRAADSLAAQPRGAKVWAVAGIDDVREGMAETGYPADRVHLHPGLVEDTVPEQAPDTIALLRLDTDWYSSTKHELEHLYTRLSPGGVLILDDYSDWEGARKATDDWLEATGEPLFLVPMGAGVIAVKPR